METHADNIFEKSCLSNCCQCKEKFKDCEGEGLFDINYCIKGKVVAIEDIEFEEKGRIREKAEAFAT